MLYPDRLLICDRGRGAGGRVQEGAELPLRTINRITREILSSVARDAARLEGELRPCV